MLEKISRTIKCGHNIAYLLVLCSCLLPLWAYIQRLPGCRIWIHDHMMRRWLFVGYEEFTLCYCCSERHSNDRKWIGFEVKVLVVQQEEEWIEFKKVESVVMRKKRAVLLTYLHIIASLVSKSVSNSTHVLISSCNNRDRAVVGWLLMKLDMCACAILECSMVGYTCCVVVQQHVEKE